MHSRYAREDPGSHYPLGTWLQREPAGLRWRTKPFCINTLHRCLGDTHRSAITLPTVHLLYGVAVWR